MNVKQKFSWIYVYLSWLDILVEMNFTFKMNSIAFSIVVNCMLSALDFQGLLWVVCFLITKCDGPRTEICSSESLYSFYLLLQLN